MGRRGSVGSGDDVSPEFRWTFEWSSAEYRRALAAVVRHRAPTRTIRLLKWVIGTLVVLIAVLAALIGLAGGPAALLPFAPWIGLVVLLLAIMKWGLPWIGVARYPERGRGEIVFWATDGEVGQKSPLASSVSPWSVIERGVETDDFLLLYFAPTAAYYVPKRVLTESELAEFRAFVAERVPVMSGDSRP